MYSPVQLLVVLEGDKDTRILNLLHPYFAQGQCLYATIEWEL